MNKYKLSILIPARSEMFLKNTVEDILKNKEDNTEIIVGLDGKWSDPPLIQHPDVSVIYIPESIGQRAITNLCARLSKATWVMKVDAHASFDKGFDRKMIEAFKEVGDNVTMVPIMRNLHAFDWKCRRCGWIKYQGPTPKRCEKCNDSRYIVRKMRWIGKLRPQSTSYSFNSEPHFQYFNEYTKRPECKEMVDKTGFNETMSLQGSAFMLTREKYWELNICDEEVGSWGNQGIETACKTWLSGGRVLVNRGTWYAHMFRTQGGDFGFPYSQSGNEVARTKKKVWNFFLDGKWDKQIYPVSWLIKKFWPVPGWAEEDLSKVDKINGI